MNKKQKHQRGSVLVFSLLVLTLLLSIAISGAAVVIADKNAARSTDKSVLSFQIADGAVENILKRVYRDNPSTGPLTDATLDNLAGNLYGSTTGCTGGVIRGVLPSSSGTYSAGFFESDGITSIGCSDGSWRTKLAYLKVTGTYAGTTRALSVGVKP